MLGDGLCGRVPSLAVRLQIMRRRSLLEVHVLLAFRRGVLSLIARVYGQLGERVVHMSVDDTERVPIVLRQCENRMMLIDLLSRTHHVHRWRCHYRSHLRWLVFFGNEVPVEAVEPLIRIDDLSSSRYVIHEL